MIIQSDRALSSTCACADDPTCETASSSKERYVPLFMCSAITCGHSVCLNCVSSTVSLSSSEASSVLDSVSLNITVINTAGLRAAGARARNAGEGLPQQ